MILMIRNNLEILSQTSSIPCALIILLVHFCLPAVPGVSISQPSITGREGEDFMGISPLGCFLSKTLILDKVNPGK